jgi:hypothetical protein
MDVCDIEKAIKAAEYSQGALAKRKGKLSRRLVVLSVEHADILVQCAKLAIKTLSSWQRPPDGLASPAELEASGVICINPQSR